MIERFTGTAFPFVLLLTFSFAAQANSITKLDIRPLEGFAEAPLIKVYSTDGEKWDAVDVTAVARFKVRLNAECRYEGRGNKAYEGDLIVAGFDIIGDTDPPDFLIPESGFAEASFRYAGGGDQLADPVAVCATELTKRLSQDQELTRYHVLADGFRVDYPGAFEVKYRMYCHRTGLGRTDLGSDTTLVNARIQCAASDLAAGKIPKPEPKKLVSARLISLIKSISFEPDPAEYRGECPVGIQFNGSITTTRAGEVKYRYVSHDNRVSPVFSLTFNAAGTRTTRPWSRVYSEPEAGGRLAGAPGGQTWDYQDWYRLEILSPESIAPVQAQYRIACGKPKPARIIKRNN